MRSYTVSVKFGPSMKLEAKNVQEAREAYKLATGIISSDHGIDVDDSDETPEPPRKTPRKPTKPLDETRPDPLPESTPPVDETPAPVVQ